MIPDYGGKLKGTTPIFKRDQCRSKGTSTNNIGYPKLREHLGAVIATMKLSSDWHDFKAKLDKNYPRIGKPTQLSLEFADDEADTGKGL